MTAESVPPLPRPEEELAALVPKVRRWLWKLCRSAPDLDDLTQEVLLEIARALPRFEGRSRLDTFAYRVTYRVALRRQRARRRRNEVRYLEAVAPPADHVDPHSTLLAREVTRRLHRVLDRLPAATAAAFIACELEGLTPTEVAEIEGERPGTIRARLHRARKEVRRRMAHDPYVRALGGGKR